jgi:hypothetical protein
MCVKRAEKRNLITFAGHPIINGNIQTENNAILLRFFTPPPTPPQKGRGVVFYSA